MLFDQLPNEQLGDNADYCDDNNTSQLGFDVLSDRISVSVQREDVIVQVCECQ